MYELSALRPPFNAFNITGLAQKIRKSTLTALPSMYSAAWSKIIDLMLRKNPDKRPTVEDMLTLPDMREAVRSARARARALMPDVAMPSPTKDSHHFSVSIAGGSTVTYSDCKAWWPMISSIA